MIIKLTEFDGEKNIGYYNTRGIVKKMFESEVKIDFREGLKKTID